MKPEKSAIHNTFKWILAGITIIILAAAFPGVNFAQHHSTTHARTKAVSTSELAPPVKAYGSKDAPIRMEVFSDYQCPSCGNFFEQTLRPMTNDYVAAGKVYLVHRDFPLPMHAYSHQAARWANAAAEIGQFEAVDASLFDNQNSWAVDGKIDKYISSVMSPADFKRVEKIMANCGPEAVSGCPVDAWINSDVALGKQIPVQATPTFVIYYKGQKFPAASGVVSWSVMRQFFDSLLKQ